MSSDKEASEFSRGSHREMRDGKEPATTGGLSRRGLLRASAAGAVAGALSAFAGGVAASPDTAPLDHARNGEQGDAGQGRGRDLLLKGGVVLTMDPQKGDFVKADVLISGTKIKAVGPDLGGGDVIDCRGMIIMPGFIDTHHHNYQAIQRAVVPDGVLGDFYKDSWPQETYVSVAHYLWTYGQIPAANFEGPPLWDLGGSPYAPEDCYISELVSSWAGIDAGVTTCIDTSQSSHTPEHTDALIKGLKDSGRRTLFVYSQGRPDQHGNEFPGAIGDEHRGIGRLRKQWFSSNDQLVTLGLGGWFADPTLWPLARAFGAQIVNHDSDGAGLVANQHLVGPDMVSIHCNDFNAQAWQVAKDKGVHISCSGPIEMQMAHGTPAFQAALDRGILPSLSSDVETNMTPDMFTQMRTAFTLQRMFVNTGVNPGRPLLSCRQVLQMATVAGAAAAGLSNKVGMLRPGMEADVIMLNARTISTHPMLNAPGTVVTMMDRSHVDTVIIGGKIKKRAGQLIGVDVERLFRDIENSQQRVLARIRSKPLPVGGLHSEPGYTPSLLNSCCLSG